MVFISHNNSPKILQPSKQPLNLPPTFVTSQNSAVLRFCLFSIGFMRRDKLNAKFFQLPVQRVRVIGFVADYLWRSLVGKSFRNSPLDKFNLVRRSRLCVDGERKTSAVCHCHEFRAFAPLGLSHFAAPFLAETKVPSIKHSDKSNLPRVRKSSAKVSNTRFKVPSLTHIWKRRRHVWYGGNLSGKSCHRAPVRNIQRIPSSTSRFSLHGLPRPSSRRLGSAISGSSIAHCSSVNFSFLAMLKI